MYACKRAEANLRPLHAFVMKRKVMAKTGNPEQLLLVRPTACYTNGSISPLPSGHLWAQLTRKKTTISIATLPDCCTAWTV